MRRILGHLFGRGGGVAGARDAERRGDFAHAAILFAQGGRHDEAARVMILRGDAEADLQARLRHYSQAAHIAPGDSPFASLARLKKASTAIAMAWDAPLTEAVRRELIRAAAELEAIGEHGRAADAYARAGDMEGQVRALESAGDVDRLDDVLGAAQWQERARRERQIAHDEVATLIASGRRGEAVAIARASSDERLRERGRTTERQRVTGCLVRARVSGRELMIVLGDTVLLGRSDDANRDSDAGDAGTVAIGCPALSRRHLSVARREGVAVVRDLGSKNGTTLGGKTLSGDVPVGDGLTLQLGGELAVALAPTDDLPGAVAIDVSGERWIAPLGLARLGVGSWRLDPGRDRWVELVTEEDPPAFVGDIRLAPRVTLLAGDAIASARTGPVVLEIGPIGR